MFAFHNKACDFSRGLFTGNSDLVKSRVRNYERMRERTLAFTLSLTYENSHEVLARAAGVIEDAIRNEARTRFVRAHFIDYQAQGLVFEVAYAVRESYADAYRKVRHAINLVIFRAFREQGVELAHQVAAHTQPLPGRTPKETP